MPCTRRLSQMHSWPCMCHRHSDFLLQTRFYKLMRQILHKKYSVWSQCARALKCRSRWDVERCEREVEEMDITRSRGETLGAMESDAERLLARSTSRLVAHLLMIHNPTAVTTLPYSWQICGDYLSSDQSHACRMGFLKLWISFHAAQEQLVQPAFPQIQNDYLYQNPRPSRIWSCPGNSLPSVSGISINWPR